MTVSLHSGVVQEVTVETGRVLFQRDIGTPRVLTPVLLAGKPSPPLTPGLSVTGRCRFVSPESTWSFRSTGLTGRDILIEGV